MNKYLVIGASGLVGGHLLRILKNKGDFHLGTYNTTPFASGKQLDITQRNAVLLMLHLYKPDFVFLPAGQTNVEYCEKNQADAYKVNVVGVKNIVDACNSIGARLIYFSTDYIFDGKYGPYDEDEPANPLSEYGRQKLEAEHLLLFKSSNFIIIRTTIVYGWEQLEKNFVYRLIQTRTKNQSIKIPADQFGTPTYAPALAQSAIELSLTDARGIFNIAGPDCINRYQFAIEVAKVFFLPKSRLIPVTTNELGQLAKRPLSAGLKTEKARSYLQSRIPTYSEGLVLMSKEIQRNPGET